MRGPHSVLGAQLLCKYLTVIPFVDECIECFEDKRLFLSSIDAISYAPSSRRLTYLVDPVRVEGDIILDLRHCFKWSLISPHRVA